VIVNGDVRTADDAREALRRSGADGVMLGRGVYGRPWIAAEMQAALDGGAVEAEPDAAARHALVTEHLHAVLAFYGEGLGIRTFRKHLGWYVEQAPWPSDPLERRAAKARLCRLESAAEVDEALAVLWELK
jgi:tRNA-dihydrouridine synthase